MRGRTLFTTSMMMLLVSASAHSQIVVTFAPNDGLFDDISPTTNVNLSSFDQSTQGSNYSLDLTATGTSTTTGNSLNVASTGRLGVSQVAGGTDSTFTAGDFMVFDFNMSGSGRALAFQTLNFSSQSTSGSEKFTLTSSAFDGRNFESIWANDTDNAISFNEATDTFTFTNTTATTNVAYDLATGGLMPVIVYEGESMTLGYTGTGTAGFNGFTVHAVPEPASIGFLSACAFGFAVYRRKRKSA